MKYYLISIFKNKYANREIIIYPITSHDDAVVIGSEFSIMEMECRISHR